MTSKKNIALILICLFLLSLIVRFVPVWRKGYSFCPFGGNLALAKNFSLTGEYKIENKKNVILSSVNIREQGIPCNLGNQLTAVFYGWTFKIFGFHLGLPLYVSLLLWSLSGSLLFLLVYRLFDLKLAIIFSFVEMLMPFVLRSALMPGFYEWAILFFTIGLIFYLHKKEIGFWSLFLASVFFGLAVLTRNAFLVSFPPLVIYDFWNHKSWKRMFVFILPFSLIFGGSLISGYLRGSTNAYLSAQDTSFSFYGHLYPDPYTFHFEKEAYLEKILKAPNVTATWFLMKYGYQVGLKNKIIRYARSIFFYPRKFILLVYSGGPLIILFLLGGLVYLYKKNIYLFKLFIIWSVCWYAGLIFLKTSNWDHFLELEFLIILLVSLGIYWLIEFIWQSQLAYKRLIILILIIALFAHFIQANKWMLHEQYTSSNIEMVMKLKQELEHHEIDKKGDIIALDIHTVVYQSLAYYTDYNIIYFDSQTIDKLLADHKLSWAFEQFGVTKIIGFSEKRSQQIIEQTGVQNLSNLN